MFCYLCICRLRVLRNVG